MNRTAKFSLPRSRSRRSRRSLDTSTIRWGIDPTYPPFEAKQPDGSLAGFDIDLRNAICEQLHAKCVWVEQGFDGMIPALRARKFDVIMSAMTATDERLKQIDFSNKLYASPGALVAPVGSTLLPTAASLAGKRVGIDQARRRRRTRRPNGRPRA